MSGPTSELKSTLRDSVTRAGAGAGKTRGLVEKVVEVYRDFATHGERPRIIVTTFTRKATQELKERLILHACKAQDSGLLQFVTDPSKLQISTIHGLLNVFLKQYGHLAGLDAGFEIVSEAQAYKLARLALRETLVAEPEALTWLESYGFERLLGMCRLYERFVREQGEARPATLEEIEAAARIEVARWRQELLSLAGRIVEEVDEPKWREYGEALRLFMAQYSGASSELEGLPKKPRRSAKTEHLEVWHERLERLADFKKEMTRPCWDVTAWPRMAEVWEEFAPFGDAFVAAGRVLKDGQARFEMSDLELKSVEILREQPFLGEVFAENWDFWMIDEYQDTSPLQVACLNALIAGRPTYYVGDPQQSIYLFRGAEVRVFDDAERDVRARGGEVRELMRNWRSDPDLLLFMNDFMASLNSSSEFRAMQPRTESAERSRECVRMHHAADESAELLVLVERVQQLMADGAALEQICVLGRTHRTLMDVSRALRAYGFPTHVHSARGFNTRREVLDASALWKFLVNPHDNLNLLLLLRSPWFYVEDFRLAAWMENRPQSLWRRLEAETDDVPESLQRLRMARTRVASGGLPRAFEETLLSAAYLDLSLVHDPAGRKESNLWKLIHRARALEKEGGASMLDFLEAEVSGDALDSAEGDATSAQEPNAINLMTIHGAKGLEFDHVLLPRMGEAPRPAKIVELSGADGRFFFPVKDDATGEFIPSPLDDLRRRDQHARELAEFDRQLYVALTRAKKTLTLTWSDVKNDSWADRSAWFSQPPGTYGPGTYSYRIQDGVAEPVAFAGQSDTQTELREPWTELAARDSGSGEVLTSDDGHLSVTKLVGEAKPETPSTAVANDPPAKLLRRWQAQVNGTRIHRALEALKYGHEWPEDPDVQFVWQHLDPPFREFIEAGEVEWGFQVQTAQGVIEGQIDLWAVHDDRLYVVDYKSGSDEFKDAAFRQLEIYAWALRRFGHRQPVELVVVYPRARKIERRTYGTTETDDLFRRWELEFSGSDRGRENNF